MSEIKLYKRPLKELRYYFLIIPLVAIGIWMVSSEPTGTTNYIVGWLCISFFGLMILVGLFQLFDRRPQIIITEQGVWDRTTKEAEIRWEQIQSARAQKVNLYVSELKIDEHTMTDFINEIISSEKLNRKAIIEKYFEH